MVLEQIAILVLSATLIFSAGLVLNRLIGLRHSAATRHAILTHVSACALLLPLLHLLPHPATPVEFQRVTLTPLELGVSTFTTYAQAQFSQCRPWLTMVWLVGLVWHSVKILAGWLGARHLVAAAVPLVETHWQQTLRDATARMKVPSLVILESDKVHSPALIGCFRPKIIVPTSASEWSTSRRMHVVLHELAHASRRDIATHLLSSLVCAIYWFHPLAWITHRHLLLEQERAADDRVLLTGVKASSYAGDLLALAQSVSESPPLMALAFARPLPLSQRIESVLSEVQRRPPRCLTKACGFATAWIVTMCLPGGEIFAQRTVRATPMDDRDAEWIRPIVRAHEKQFVACYLPALAIHSNLQGDLVMGWDIRHDGRVEQVEVLESTLVDSDMLACIVQVIGEFRFPARPRGSSHVVYPFTFSPD